MSKQIIKSLQRAGSQLPKADLEKILAAQVEPMVRHDHITLQSERKARRPVRRLVATCACALVLLAGAVTAGWFLNYRVTDAVVDIDMNPSYEILVNRQQQVLGINPLNADAEETLMGRQYKGWAVEEAVYTLFTGISEQGLIRTERPAILVSVEGKNATRATQLQEKVANTIDMFMLGTEAEANIVTQPLSAEDELRAAADRYGVSTGKMQIVRGLLEQGALFTEEELVGMDLETLLDLAVAYALQGLNTEKYTQSLVEDLSRSFAASSSLAGAPASSAPASSAAPVQSTDRKSVV